MEDSDFGGAGDDCVVDEVTCPEGDGNQVYGNANDDTVWVGKDGCGTASTDWRVDGDDSGIGNAGTDDCGDSDWIPPHGGNFYNCDNQIATLPAACARTLP